MMKIIVGVKISSFFSLGEKTFSMGKKGFKLLWGRRGFGNLIPYSNFCHNF
jgi:hypothetical protein